MIKWVLLAKLANDTGYSQAALRQKIQRGDWVENVHYRHSPDRRIQINIEAYIKWVEGLRPELHQEAKKA